MPNNLLFKSLYYYVSTQAQSHMTKRGCFDFALFVCIFSFCVNFAAVVVATAVAAVVDDVVTLLLLFFRPHHERKPTSPMESPIELEWQPFQH